MPLNGCSSGLFVTALVTLLLLPAHYYVPDFGSKELAIEPAPLIRGSVLSPGFDSWFSLDFPPLDIFLTLALILWATVTYLCDWIQRKLMERRILKLNGCVRECAARVRSWDARREQAEATLRLVRAAGAEYNLLLCLLLRRRRLLAADPPLATRCLDKDLDDIDFITKPTNDV